MNPSKRRQQILKAIYAAIDEINSELPPSQKINKIESSLLFGDKGKLDSFDLINLIAETEKNINQKFDINITLADDRALSQKNNPFGSVKNLADYLEKLIQGGEHGKK